jgi:hypothetical protein
MTGVFDISVFYVFLSVVFGCLLSYLLYYKENNITNKKILYSLFSIRSIFFSILFFLLFNPTYKFFQREIEKPVVIIAQDYSSSIKDSTYSLLNDLGSSLHDFEVHYLSFSDVVKEGLQLVNDGLRTNYSKFFIDLDNRFKNRNVAACVFASDGIYNTGSNPLYNNNILFPIYPIALGDTTVKRDVGILKVEHNEVAFLGNEIPMNIGVSMNEAKGERVRLLISNNEEIIYKKIIDINNNDEYLNINLLIKVADLGVQTYNITISPIDNEENLINNNYVTYIDVIDSQHKILALYKDVHPDISAYRSVLNDYNHFDMDLIHVNDFDNNLKEYDLLIIFGDVDGKKIENIINSTDISLMIFDFNKFSYRNKLTNVISFSPKGYQELIYATKNDNFSKYTFSEGLLSLIKTAPPLSTSFGDYSLVNGLEVVLYQKVLDLNTGKPIVSLYEEDNRKIGFLTAKGFWKWRMFDFLNNEEHNYFNEFFIKLTQYLLLDNKNERFRLNWNNYYTENEKVFLKASFFNEIYEKVNDPDIHFKLVKDNGDEFDFLFLRNMNEYYLDVGKLGAGKYSFVANVDGFDIQKKGTFSIAKIQMEQLDNRADHSLLSLLALNSDGKLFHMHESKDLLNLIKSNSNNIMHMKEKFQSLINMPWILLILLFLIFLEWFLRKYNGFL